MKYRYIVLFLMLAMSTLSLPAFAQVASSPGFALSAGEVVGGGGSSGSTNFGITGTVIGGPGGRSTSTGFILNGGVTAAGAVAVSAIYDRARLDTAAASGEMLKVAVVGGTGTPAGEMHYRFGGQGTFAAIPLTVGAGDTLQLQLGTNLLTARGLDYYFTIERGGIPVQIGDPADPYTFVVQMTNATGQRPAALPEASYRMVGVPMNISGSRAVTSVFGDDLGAYDITQWRLGRYSAAADSVVEYPGAASVQPGYAYWMIARGGARYGAAGHSRLPNRVYNGNDYFEVPLDSGWNQVANPLAFPAEASALLVDDGVAVGPPDGSQVEDSIYYYNGSTYTTPVAIPAWEGVFVKANRPGLKLLFPFAETVGGVARRDDSFADAGDDWHLKLSLLTAGVSDYDNFVGVHRLAKAGPDPFDYDEPPMAPEGVSLAFELPETAGPLYRSDFRPRFTEGATWDIVLSPGSQRSLAVKNLDRLPVDLEAWLVLDVGTAVKLEKDATVDVPDDVVRASLIVGKSEYTREQVAPLLPTEYVLDQNFPNPFNPVTSIRFALPKAGEISLVVYNVLGQEVARPADGMHEAGVHTVEWRARDDRGMPLASGVYFYRLVAEDFTQTRKMLLVK